MCVHFLSILLGEVTAANMAMAATTHKRPTIETADALETMEPDGYRYDLIRGVLHQMSPAGARHGELSAELARHLANFVAAGRIGKVYGAETGFRLADDTVLGPDVAFVAMERLPPLEERDGFLRLAPDLAVEIVSPWDRARYVNDKVMEYLDAGVRLVWVVEPKRRTVTAYGADRIARVLRESDTLEGGDVLPGFRLPLLDLFA